MDENRFERFKELVGQIEPTEDAKERILENVIYKKSRKVHKLIKYMATAAAAVFICIIVINMNFYKEDGNQSGFNVYATELDEENWLVLPEGEKRQLSGPVEEGWGYQFRLELPKDTDYFYTLSAGTSIGIDWIYFSNNTIRWYVHDDSEYDFPDYMESELIIFLADEEGNRIGRYRLILSKEGDACFVELVNESEKIENDQPAKTTD